ncbi:MAG TPA: lysylphosphatidylglycerol synthase transmembrane domain-containing protein, partial [Gammaproteobacteria bacterium]
MKPWTAWSLKLAGTILAFGALFWLIDLEAAVDAARKIQPLSLVAGFFFYAAGLAIAALRWRYVLARHEIFVPWIETLRVNLTGIFASTFLPGAVGGDLIRPLMLQTPAPASRTTLYASIAFERLTGIAATLTWSGLGLLLLPPTSISGPLRFGLAIAVSCLVAGILALTLAGPMIARIGGLPERLRTFASNFSRFFRTVLTRPRVLVATYGFSLAFQLSMILMYSVFILGLTEPESLAALLLAPPVAWLASMVPVSVNGFGIREGTLALVLSSFGVDKAAAGGAALLAVVPMLLAAAAGFVILLHSRATLASIRERRRS